MFNRKRLKQFTTLSLLAFLFSATIPFFASSAAQAGFSLSGKSLLCTVRGYEFISVNETVNSNVIVIKSPLADINNEQKSTDNIHCSSCFIYSPLADLPLIVSSKPPVPENFNHAINPSNDQAPYRFQYFLLSAPSRAPPYTS